MFRQDERFTVPLTWADIAMLNDQEFAAVWEAMGKVVRVLAATRANANKEEDTRAEALRKIMDRSQPSGPPPGWGERVDYKPRADSFDATVKVVDPVPTLRPDSAMTYVPRTDTTHHIRIPNVGGINKAMEQGRVTAFRAWNSSPTETAYLTSQSLDADKQEN